MGVSINKVTNANIYVDGANFLGRAEEINLPTIKSNDVEHKALGMFGKLMYGSGLDNMEADIKWNSYYPEVLKKFGNIFKGIKLQVRSSMDTYENNTRTTQKQILVLLTVRPKEIPGGNFKQHDNVDLSSKLQVSYYKLEIDGQEIIEVDVENNIYKVDGVDQLAEYRSNLGI